MPWMAENNTFFEDTLMLSPDPADGIQAFNGYAFLAIIFVWCIIFFCIYKGVAVTGKVVYFTAGLPVFVLGVMVINGLALEGSADGIKAYIGNWDMSQLGDGTRVPNNPS